ncbi:MAG: cobalamin-binding protein [Bacteroidetes bacterium]|nr:cobalamin-binding protein [Bacteroidota bacterium]MCL5027234.1 cobalamin-binding protein [Chloroflexota bacterium]
MRGLFISLALATLLAAGCARGPAAPPVHPSSGDFPLSFTDDAGRAVTIPSPPKRIVSLSPSNTEILYYLGLQDLVIGVDDYSDYPPQARTKEKVGGFANTNLEKVVALGPDLVLATEIHVQQVVPELERRGLRVVVLMPERLEDVLVSLQLVGKMGGKAQEADQAADALRARLDAITGKVATAGNRPRVFYEVDATPTSVGPGTFLDDLITKAGGDNIAADAQSKWPRLSPESIVLRDPEVIVLADHGFGETVEKVKARPGWDKISAVRNERVAPVDVDITNRPGPRAVDGLEELAKIFHPEVFR